MMIAIVIGVVVILLILLVGYSRSEPVVGGGSDNDDDDDDPPEAPSGECDGGELVSGKCYKPCSGKVELDIGDGLYRKYVVDPNDKKRCSVGCDVYRGGKLFMKMKRVGGRCEFDNDMEVGYDDLLLDDNAGKYFANGVVPRKLVMPRFGFNAISRNTKPEMWKDSVVQCKANDYTVKACNGAEMPPPCDIVPMNNWTPECKNYSFRAKDASNVKDGGYAREGSIVWYDGNNSEHEKKLDDYKSTIDSNGTVEYIRMVDYVRDKCMAFVRDVNEFNGIFNEEEIENVCVFRHGLGDYGKEQAGVGFDQDIRGRLIRGNPSDKHTPESVYDHYFKGIGDHTTLYKIVLFPKEEKTRLYYWVDPEGYNKYGYVRVPGSYHEWKLDDKFAGDVSTVDREEIEMD